MQVGFLVLLADNYDFCHVLNFASEKTKCLEISDGSDIYYVNWIFWPEFHVDSRFVDGFQSEARTNEDKGLKEIIWYSHTKKTDNGTKNDDQYYSFLSILSKLTSSYNIDEVDEIGFVKSINIPADGLTGIEDNVFSGKFFDKAVNENNI